MRQPALPQFTVHKRLRAMSAIFFAQNARLTADASGKGGIRHRTLLSHFPGWKDRTAVPETAVTKTDHHSLGISQSAYGPKQFRLRR